MGEKPHICEACNEGFSFRNQLAKHRSQHYTLQSPISMTASEVSTWEKTIAVGDVESRGHSAPEMTPSKDTPEDIMEERNKGSTEDSENLRSEDVTQTVSKADMLQTAIAMITGNDAIGDDDNVHAGDLQSDHLAAYLPSVQTFNIEVQEVSDSMKEDVADAVQQEALYTCALCNASFDDVSQLEEHRDLCSAGTEVFLLNSKLITCPICDQKFSSKDSLQQHVRIHTGEVPCECESCGETFRYRIQLSRHRYLCNQLTKKKSSIKSRASTLDTEEMSTQESTSKEPNKAECETRDNVQTDNLVSAQPKDIGQLKENLKEDEEHLDGVGIRRKSSRLSAGKLDPVLLMLKKRGRGRPPKSSRRNEADFEENKSDKTKPVVKKTTVSAQNQNTAEAIPKRKRGRPPKVKEEPKGQEANTPSKSQVPATEQVHEAPASPPPKRKRGRPRKIQPNPECPTSEAEKKNPEEDGRPRRKRVCPQRYLPKEDNSLEDAEQAKGSPSKVTTQGQSLTYECVPCKRPFSCYGALKKHETSMIHRQGPVSEQRRFICSVCKQGFTRAEHLRDHSVVHSGQKPNVCIVCNRGFSFRSQLAKHRNREHTAEEVEQAKIEKPHLGIRKWRTLKRLVEAAGGDEDDPTLEPLIDIKDEEEGKQPGRIVCKKCGKRFSEMRLFNRHIFSHYSVKPFTCDVCNRGFSRADSLRNHRTIHAGPDAVMSPDKLFLCDTCGRQFKRVEALRNHVKLHFGVRPWVCKVCGKGFADKYTLSRHEVIHQSDKPWLCATCGRGFNRKNHLEAHEAQHLGIKLHACTICSRSFAEQSNLRRHMAVHSEERPWKCNVCGEGFKRKANMEDHETTHLNEKKAKCDTCGARFTTKRYLRVHKLIHSGLRPHKCSTCAATFRHLSALITHRRVHTGHTPYKCAHCPRAYKYYDQWKAHEYAHTDPKPYKCLVCQAAFRQAGTLRQHRQTAHGNKKLSMVYLCSICKKTFASSSSLIRHMKRVHLAQASLQHIQGDVDVSASSEVPEGTAGSEPEPTPDGDIPSTNIIQLLNSEGRMTTLQMTDGSKGLDDQAELSISQANLDQMQITDGQNIIHFVSNIDGMVEMSGVQSDAIVSVVQVPTSDGSVATLTPMTDVQTSANSPTDINLGNIVHYASTADVSGGSMADAQAVVEAVIKIESAEQPQINNTLTTVSNMVSMASIDGLVSNVELVGHADGSLNHVPAIATVETISSEDSMATLQSLGAVHDNLAAPQELGTMEQVESFTNLAAESPSHDEDLQNDQHIITSHELTIEQNVGETVSVATSL